MLKQSLFSLRTCLLLTSLCFLAVVFLSFTYIGDSRHSNNNTYTRSCGQLCRNFTSHAFQYVPHSTLSLWKEKEFLMVLGISSLDIPLREKRRNLQRETCWQYDGIATRENNYNGLMLVLYSIGRHYSHDFEFSTSLQQEAERWHDIVSLSLREPRPSTNKKIGGSGYWGLEAEVSMSKKTFVWYFLAVRAFPFASYLGKGDDDMFLYVPQYLADLSVLPRKGLHWGYPASVNVQKYQLRLLEPAKRIKLTELPYAGGPCMTLARDLVEKLAKFEPLWNPVATPFDKSREAEYLSLAMQHEDVMVGLALYNAGHPVIDARDEPCRFHNVQEGRQIMNTNVSIMIHHVAEEDYELLVRKYKNRRVIKSGTRFNRKGNRLRFVCT